MTEIKSKTSIYEIKHELDKEDLLERKARRDQKKNIQEKLEGYNLSDIEAKKGDQNVLRQIGSLERDAKLIKQSIMFINPVISNICPLAPGALYIVGAPSGTGKSTVAAAEAHALYKQGKKTFVISNEETQAKILARIACAELGIDFQEYIQGNCLPNIRKQVAAEIKNIEPLVTVADEALGSTTIESIEKLLHQVDEDGTYSCIIIDFFQRISKSSTNPSLERTMVLYNFKDIITDYAQHAKTPVILMVQLVPLPAEEQDRNVENRIKWCKGIYEAAASVVEVIKVRGLPVSNFYIAKGRFSRSDITVACRYENGKFSFINKKDLSDLKAKIQMDQISEMVSGMTDLHGDASDDQSP